jgi:hypothetical protein
MGWLGAFLVAVPSLAADVPAGVRGLVTKAPGSVTIDGKLDEWAGAFSTPLHYNHNNLLNRAAQFAYMWDDTAFYVGLRALDKQRANPGKSPSLWNGDAVEFYFDARTGSDFRGKDWTKGAIHFYYTPFDGTEVMARWAMRGGIATSDTVLEGVEVAATAQDWGYEVEFKLPWSNFPDFKPAVGAQIAVDAELCSGDGQARTDRTFAYGSPLSVQQPASQGAVMLVDSFERSTLPAVGAACFPMWVDTPWVQPERAKVQAVVAIAPSLIVQVGKVEVRLHDVDGHITETIAAPIEKFGPEGKGFARAVARWPIDLHAPNTYFATAVVTDKAGGVLARVAPRMNQEAQMSGR